MEDVELCLAETVGQSKVVARYNPKRLNLGIGAAEMKVSTQAAASRKSKQYSVEMGALCGLGD